MTAHSQAGMEGPPQSPKLLDEVRHILRLQRYSMHTERLDIDWIRRYVHFSARLEGRAQGCL